MNINDVKNDFNKVINNLKNSITDVGIYNEFIKTISVIDFNDREVLILLKNSYGEGLIKEKYLSLIQEELNKINNLNLVVITTIDPNKRLNQAQTTSLVSQYETNLNKNLLFENYVVSDFNKAAYSALQSILSKPLWNPIFICGGVGLGKTHLLHAIGNEFKKQNPNKLVKYIGSDEFIRIVFNAISNGSDKVEELKNQYQQYDLLMVDDVQFLAKKDKMNEIFFNIFNYDITHNHTIILSSDKMPNELHGIDPRMTSRFASGLIITINNPNLNSMKEILKKKIQNLNINYIFPEETLDYIVRHNNKDIRQLEGFLNTLIFFIVNNLPSSSVISINTLQSFINNNILVKTDKSKVNPEFIIKEFALVYNIDETILKSNVRKKQIVQIRHIIMYVMREYFNMILEDIGKVFNKHHTSVMEGIEKAKKLLAKDNELKIFIEKIVKKI